jgi:hypothetical protein
MISVAVTSSTISASAGGSSVTATVGSSPVSAAASGGVGPQGPAGAIGDASSITIASASDAAISGLADGDVLRYSSSKWRNYAESGLVDGGNFG